ncbi:quinone-dependent dihydroorotate dehydrogenase [Prochlorococcus marinus]|uniref:Dihydroorotate dehydrogenase (quinone) n=1 Tax=Prochlorococcus marinus (strain MIT 9211) TaxID=93059 RepID=A9BDG2_PROM4|nr:quinone-dependent dihydroorotate dehydrogenase [Prochlorococcus marinus]ABX08148.1 Dihydroorotate dehydrogenase [Prochlorococcus marinus str. MIT 9211]
MAHPSESKFLSIKSVYQRFLSPILSEDEGIDAEQLTNFALNTLGQVSIYRQWPGFSGLLAQVGKELQRSDPRLTQKLFGCNFDNPIGLAAGFDKNAIAAGIWHYFGFGFAELGTVTWHPQQGNPKPRLFRLAKEQAALNRMGFNNNGAIIMRSTLEKQKISARGQRPAVLGINFGKSKICSLEQAADDYAASLELLAPLADYAVINVSSPNTPGLRKLQDPKQLRRLIERLRRLRSCPPLLVKISPDLEDHAISDLAKLAYEEGLAGIIAINTSVDRLGLGNRVISQTGLTLGNEVGGLSGAPLNKRAIEVIKLLRESAGENLPLIGVGGINSPQHAWERISAGATLLQIYTGWIFQGPTLVPLILDGLSSQLDQHGFRNITEAIGSNAPWI